MRCKGCYQDKDYDEGGWASCAWLCEECKDRPRYRYYLLNRPPGIGCQPDGFVDRETWLPSRKIPDGDYWHALGWVEYLRPLSMEEVWKKELRPADPEEWKAYLEWRE